MKEKLKPVINLGKEFAGGMGKRNLTVYATSGCYYLFMSLVPTVMILCCILPFTPFNLQLILQYIDEYFAESLAVILRNIASAVYSSNSATLTVSIVLTLYSASASMKAIMKGIDSAYQCENKDNFIKFSLRALVYMVLLVVTILMSLIIMVYGGKILSLIQKYFENVGPLKYLLSKGRYGLVMITLAVVFLFLYKLMPADKVNLKDQLPGAVFTAVIWVIFSWIFTIYISVSNKFGAYGFIGTIMVTMMWMYYCLFFLLIGGFMNSFLASKKAEKEGFLLVDSTGETESWDGAESRMIPESVDGENSAVNGFAANADGLSLDEFLEEALPEDGTADEAAEDGEKKKKKKIPVPVIAGAAACAVAAIAAVFFFVFKKKKKKLPEGEAEAVVEKVSEVKENKVFQWAAGLLKKKEK